MLGAILKEHLEYDFTASLAEMLDDIANCQTAWEATMAEFWERVRS